MTLVVKEAYPSLLVGILDVVCPKVLIFGLFFRRFLRSIELLSSEIPALPH